MLENSPAPLNAASAAWQDHVRIVLVRSRNPLNIGAAARALSNFGFRHLRLVTPWEPSYLGARSAVGAAQVLLDAQLFDSVAEAVADCSLVVGTSAIGERELQHPLHPLAEGALLMRQQAHTAPVALLFGSEKFGLSNHDLSHCHWLMRIPTADQNISMNLGQAVAVCLYELARQSACPADTEHAPSPAPPAAAPASAALAPAVIADTERITQLLFDALRESGYMQPPAEAATREKLRRLLHRMNLDKADSELWQGILRQILWKLNHPDPKPKP